VCREITEPLAAVVGRGNGDLVGKNLLELAPRLDASGRLAEALAERKTWSGVTLDWPITDAPGAVGVALGAVPSFGADRAFEGFRGYGVIHLDRIVPHQPTRLVPAPEDSRSLNNVVAFPGGREFSSEDHAAFAALAAELRDRTGLLEEALAPAAMEPPAPEPPAAPEPVADVPTGGTLEVASPQPEQPAVEAPEPVAAVTPPQAGNLLAVLDRLALGVLVSRDNVPIFANRHFFELTGFRNEDELHTAGGLAHLFSGPPNEGERCESVAVRRHDGTVLPAAARMQRIDWDGLPATLLTLKPAPDTAATRSLEAEQDAAIEAMGRQHADDRRRDGAELRHLRAILETATDGVAVIDAAGNVLSLNRSGEALLGRDRGTVVGKPFLDLFAQGNQNLAKDYLDGLTTNATRSLLNDGRELEVKAPQGGTIPVFMTLGRLDHGAPDEEAGAGPDARYCALFRDLTHWKKVEHELETAKHDAERASAAKTDFLAKVSHEVRTPLNAIIGFAEVMQEERFGPVGNERYREYLRDIHASGTHVMSLINDLLDLSKIEAGRMELDPTPIDANRIISDCVGLMQTQASRGRVIMRLSLAPALPMIRADERSMRQIVLNLLSNAVKYNEPGGQVIVATAAPEDGKVLIRVRDTGAGMSEADIAAALEPFRQVSTRPMTEGTGLGLPLTKALVEANEATFAIRSKVDQGTLVEIAFPPARVLQGQR
jgi:PAS domain S-box-containing protein